MHRNAPGELEVTAAYSIHLGPRYESAGLRLQFHYNQTPGVHFKVQPIEEYRESILKGIEDGMSDRFPAFPDSGSVWINEIIDHEVDSSQRAFYKAARMAIEQAYWLAENFN